MAEQITTSIPQVKKEVNLIHLVFLGYFLATFIRTFVFTYNWQIIFSWAFFGNEVWRFFTWIIGGILGWNLLVLDNIFYIYFTNPTGELAQKAKQLYSLNLFSWVKYLAGLNIPKRAIGSALFGGAWIILAGFALTSTVSFFGKGVIMGLGLHLLLDTWIWQFKDPVALNGQLFWQIKRPVSQTEQKWYLWIFTGFFVILTILI